MYMELCSMRSTFGATPANPDANTVPHILLLAELRLPGVKTMA